MLADELAWTVGLLACSSAVPSLRSDSHTCLHTYTVFQKKVHPFAFRNN